MTTIDISSNLLEDNNVISLEQIQLNNINNIVPTMIDDIPVQQAISFSLGDSIEFNYNENENENWTKGVIAHCNADNTYHIHYQHGELTELNVHKQFIRFNEQDGFDDCSDTESVNSVNSIFFNKAKRELNNDVFQSPKLSSTMYKRPSNKSNEKPTIMNMLKKTASGYLYTKDKLKHQDDNQYARVSTAKDPHIDSESNSSETVVEEKSLINNEFLSKEELIALLTIKLKTVKKYEFESAKKEIISNNLVSMSSTHLDIIASYLNSQKMIYTESSYYTSTWLNYLMIPTILISASASVISGSGNSIPHASLIISCITAFSAFLLSIINYLKLDAASEAHKISAHQYDKLQSHIMFFSGRVLLFSEASFHFAARTQIEDKKLLEAKLNVLKRNDDDIDNIKRKIANMKLSFQQQEKEINDDIKKIDDELTIIIDKIDENTDTETEIVNTLRNQREEKEKSIEIKKTDKKKIKQEYNDKKNNQKAEIETFLTTRCKAIDREGDFARIELNSQENNIVGELLKDIKHEIEVVQERIKDIKETNQFEVPKAIRNRYPIIYNANVFSWIKTIEDYKLILTIKLWIYKNKKQYCENCICECYNILQNNPQLNAASKKNINDEILKFNKLKKKCDEIESFIFESSVSLSISYTEIDSIFEHEKKQGDLKKKWKYLFFLCPWILNVVHNDNWVEDTFIYFIYDNASKKKKKLQGLEGADNNDEKKVFWFKDTDHKDDLDNILV